MTDAKEAVCAEMAPGVADRGMARSKHPERAVHAAHTSIILRSGAPALRRAGEWERDQPALREMSISFPHIHACRRGARARRRREKRQGQRLRARRRRREVAPARGRTQHQGTPPTINAAHAPSTPCTSTRRNRDSHASLLSAERRASRRRRVGHARRCTQVRHGSARFAHPRSLSAHAARPDVDARCANADCPWHIVRLYSETYEEDHVSSASCFASVHAQNAR